MRSFKTKTKTLKIVSRCLETEAQVSRTQTDVCELMLRLYDFAFCCLLVFCFFSFADFTLLVCHQKWHPAYEKDNSSKR